MRKKGFAIFEIVLILAILAIIASIIVPNIKKARAQSQLNNCKSNIKTIVIAANEYEKDHEGLEEWCHFLAESPLYPDYISKLPTCPTGGEYKIHLNSCDGSYWVEIICCGNHTQVLEQLGVKNCNMQIRWHQHECGCGDCEGIYCPAGIN